MYNIILLVFTSVMSFTDKIFFTHLSFTSVMSFTDKIFFTHLSFTSVMSFTDKIFFTHLSFTSVMSFTDKIFFTHFSFTSVMSFTDKIFFLFYFEHYYCISLADEVLAMALSSAYNVKLLFFLGVMEYNLSDDMRDKCFSLISMYRILSFLAFNADFNTQLAFILADESLFRFFVFKSINKENILSGSAFEFGSDLTAKETSKETSYWDTYVLKCFSTSHQSLILKNVLFLLL